MIKQLLKVVRFLPVLLLFLSVSAFGQDRNVTGKVTSAEDGSTIPGVNVIVKGTQNGTVSDIDGNYSITVGSGTTLVFSGIGFATQEVVVGTQSTIDIVLTVDVTTLSEIVVVGYGTQEKKEITSAVSSIRAEDFNKGTVNDPVQLLQGKIPGLNITRPGGDPNGGFNIRLRGITTFGANAEPLVVIDGVIGGSLSTVDPNDIATFDVLKDGSAAAIYGSRGGSGVILITTKAGKAGKTEVSYNGSFALESVARTIEFMEANEFVAAGGTNLGDETDWLDVVTQQGNAMVHNLSLSGGSEKTTYYAALNLRQANGIAINSGFNQLNGRINVTQKALKNRATITGSLTSTSRESEFGFKESLRYAIIANPTMPVYDNTTTSPTAGGAYGGYAERNIFDFFNPLSIAEQNKNDGKNSLLLMSLRGEYDFSDIVDGLRISASYSNQNTNFFNGIYYSKTAKFRGSNRNGFAIREEHHNQFELFETTINYDKTIGGANLAILGGYSYQEFDNEGFGLAGGDFLTDAFTYNNMNAALDFKNGLGSVFSYKNSDKLVAFFGRANVNVNNNYFVSVSARYEGSTRFGENNKWGLFPAVSAGVTLSNLVDIPSVNNLKVRGSWGITGTRPGESYASLQRFGPTGNFFQDGVYGPSYGPISNANPNLKWETKDELDFGLDFAILDNKISGTFDWYTRNTKDLLLYKNVPVPPNLFGQTLLNIGELKNSGIEFAVNFKAVKKGNLSWVTGANFATFKTEVVSLTNTEITEGSVFYSAGMGAPGQNAFTLARVKEGEELGQLWGPIQEGVNTDGTPKFTDLDGNGSYCDCDDDKTVIGHGLPKLTAAWTNTVTYGSFDLTFLFRGSFGHDLVNSYRGFYENREGTTLQNYNIVKTEYYNPNITKAAVNNTHVEKADFVKLDNAQLGYNFKMGQNSPISRLKIYLSGQNLFVITNYTGIDPEVRMVDQIDGDGGGNPGSLDPFAPGIERRSTYFTTRTFTLGLNLNF